MLQATSFFFSLNYESLSSLGWCAWKHWYFTAISIKSYNFDMDVSFNFIIELWAMRLFEGVGTESSKDRGTESKPPRPKLTLVVTLIDSIELIIRSEPLPYRFHYFFFLFGANFRIPKSLI